ncbi:hypothetical protein UlMin_029143 [Ulmus minor]
MKLTTSFFFVILTTFFLLQINKVESADLIDKACGTARFKAYCEATLRSHPNSKNADLHGLAKISLQLAQGNATAIHDQVSKLLKTSTDKSIKPALKDCLKNYQDARDQLNAAMPALDSKQYFDVNSKATAAVNDAYSCESGFEKGKSPLSNFNTIFNRLCTIVLGVANRAAGH